MQQLAHQLLQKTIRRWVPFWRDLPKQQHLLEKLSLDPHLNAADEKVLLTWMDACLKSDGGEVGDGERSVERNIAISKKGSTHKEEERDGGCWQERTRLCIQIRGATEKYWAPQ